MDRLICALVGHKDPYRATTVWSTTWKRWQPIDPSVNVAVCSRCLRNMPGQSWSLKFQ